MKQPACDWHYWLCYYVDICVDIIWSQMILINRNVEFNRVYISMVAEPGNWDKHMYRRGKSMGRQGRTFNPRTKRSRKREPYRFPKWWIHQYIYIYIYIYILIWRFGIEFSASFWGLQYRIYYIYFFFLCISSGILAQCHQASSDKLRPRQLEINQQTMKKAIPNGHTSSCPTSAQPLGRYGAVWLLYITVCYWKTAHGAKQEHPKDSNVWLKINNTRLIETCWHD